MNLPGRTEGNWQWRFQPEALCLQIAERLALLAEVTDRIPQPCSVPSDEPFSA